MPPGTGPHRHFQGHGQGRETGRYQQIDPVRVILDGNNVDYGVMPNGMSHRLREPRFRPGCSTASTCTT